VVGVTGSNGKSTTAAMIAAILRTGGRRAWLGGNIGRSLLADLDQMGPGDWAVAVLASAIARTITRTIAGKAHGKKTRDRKARAGRIGPGIGARGAPDARRRSASRLR